VAVRLASAILFLTVLLAAVPLPGSACCCPDLGTGPSSCCIAPTEDDGVEIGCGSSCLPGNTRSSGTAERATRASLPDREDADNRPVAARFVAFDAASCAPLLETPSPPGRPSGRRLLFRIAILRV